MLLKLIVSVVAIVLLAFAILVVEMNAELAAEEEANRDKLWP